jgi:hypothetical protein
MDAIAIKYTFSLLASRTIFGSIIIPMDSALIYESIQGVIDVHCHCDPDSLPRPIDAIDLARLAKSRGVPGLVLKNATSRLRPWPTWFVRW